MNRIEQDNAAQELKCKLENCRSQLLEILDDMYTLQNEVKPHLNFIYDSYFGDLEEELQSKSLAAQELGRRIELLSKKVNRGEKLTDATIEFINTIVDKEFARKKNQAEYYQSNINDRDQVNYDKYRMDVGKIYRVLVKKLHPDIAGESENFLKFWDKVQDAYRNSDKEKIFLFAKALCPEELYEIEDRRLEDEELKLQTEITELEHAISNEKRKLERIKLQEPFILADSLNDRTWVMRRSRKLREQLWSVESEIRQRENRLKMLVNIPKANYSYRFAS